LLQPDKKPETFTEKVKDKFQFKKPSLLKELAW
jgi:hypothetical protein